MSKSNSALPTIAWWKFIPRWFSFTIVFLIMAVLFFSTRNDLVPKIIAMGILIAYGASLRYVSHLIDGKGMALVHSKQFREAIAHYERIYQFFSQYRWIDDYSYVVLLTPTKASYREMALINIAFCYGQLGDGQQAKAYYERALAEFPNSAYAAANLNLIRSVENTDAA